MMSGRREGGCPIVVTQNFALISLEYTEQRSVLTLSFECYNLKFFGQDITRTTSRSFVGHCPPSRLPDVTHVTLSPRPSPSVFAYCKRSKTGGTNGLGRRLYAKDNFRVHTAKSRTFESLLFYSLSS